MRNGVCITAAPSRVCSISVSTCSSSEASSRRQSCDAAGLSACAALRHAGAPAVGMPAALLRSGVYACKTMRTGTSRFARTTISNLISHSQAELCDIVGFGCLPWPGVRNAGGSTLLHVQMRGTTCPQRGCPTVCSCDVPLCADAATTCPVS